MIDINQETIGRWPSILPALGVPAEFLRNRHGPCPICEGKDRFRFDDKDGKGTYFCNQCGAGNGIQLLQKLNGWDFKTTANEIRRVLPESIEFKVPEKKDPLPRLRRIAKQIHPIGVEVSAYLTGRGLRLMGWKRIKEHSNLAYFEDGKKRFFPAMVALVVDVDNQPVTFHVTYLQRGKKAPVASPKKLLPCIGTVMGAAVRLGEGEHIAITEGIETGMAVRQQTGLPAWAAISAEGMKSLQVPESVKRISIYGDNDESYTGQEAAFELGKRLKREGREVEVLIPEQPGTDFADMFNATSPTL